MASQTVDIADDTSKDGFAGSVATDDTYQRFEVNPPPGSVVVKTSFYGHVAQCEATDEEELTLP